MNKPKIASVLYSLPVVQSFTLPARADLLPQIESGALEFMDIRARVFGTGKIHNPIQFLDSDMEAFALSFEGKPFLRDHEQYEIEAREGTILSSKLENGEIVQDIRITTRRGMTDYVEGRIDRFSIGWDSESAICSICQAEILGGKCSHLPGIKYPTLSGEQVCMVIFIRPVGIETSAVNVPAVDGTRIEMQLQKIRTDLLKAADAGQEPVEPVDNSVDNALQVQRETRNERLNLIVNKKIQGVPMTEKLRELLSQRAALVASAQALAAAADSEARDLTETEREEFTAILGGADDNVGKVGELDLQIARIQSERARLKLALEKTPAQEAQKPEPAAPVAPASMKRAEFNALSATEQSAYVRNGGKLSD